MEFVHLCCLSAFICGQIWSKCKGCPQGACRPTGLHLLVKGYRGPASLSGAFHIVAPATAITKYSNDGHSNTHTLFYGGELEERKPSPKSKDYTAPVKSQKQGTYKQGKAEGQKKSPPGIEKKSIALRRSKRKKVTNDC